MNMSSSKTTPAIRFFYVLIRIGLYINWAALIVLISAFMMFLLRTAFLNPQLTSPLLPDFSWLESLIQTEQSLLINPEIPADFQVQNDWLSGFLRWYPQNLLVLGTLSYIFRIILISIIIYILIKLNTLFDALKQKIIFNTKNVSCIKKIGQAILSLTIVKFIFTFNLEFAWLLFALLLFILSSIFNYGAELEEEKKLTI